MVSMRIQEKRRQARGPAMTSTRVRVVATNEEMRKSLKHPTGLRFRNGLDEAVEWPNDNFTQRRLRDGDIKLANMPAPREARQPAAPKQAEAPKQAQQEPKPGSPPKVEQKKPA